MSSSNVYIRPLMTQAGLYRCAYPIVYRAYSAYPQFGIFFLEALALDRPSIGAVPEVMPSQAGALFPYGDDAALAQAIEETESRSHSGLLVPETIRKTFLQRYSRPLFAETWNGAVRG
jgi:glycosyltransferase involved in cell wall biosynthesis